MSTKTETIGIRFIVAVAGITLAVFLFLLTFGGRCEAQALKGVTTYVFPQGSKLVLRVVLEPPEELVAGLAGLGMQKSAFNPPPDCVVIVLTDGLFELRCRTRPIEGDCGFKRQDVRVNELIGIIRIYRDMCPSGVRFKGKEIES